jgi:hypothetical protein
MNTESYLTQAMRWAGPYGLVFGLTSYVLMDIPAREALFQALFCGVFFGLTMAALDPTQKMVLPASEPRQVLKRASMELAAAGYTLTGATEEVASFTSGRGFLNPPGRVVHVVLDDDQVTVVGSKSRLRTLERALTDTSTAAHAAAA